MFYKNLYINETLRRYGQGSVPNRDRKIVTYNWNRYPERFIMNWFLKHIWWTFVYFLITWGEYLTRKRQGYVFMADPDHQHWWDVFKFKPFIFHELDVKDQFKLII